MCFMPTKTIPKLAFKRILEDYLEAKKMLSLLSDASNPQSQLVRPLVSLEQAETLRKFVSWAEDIGVHLIHKGKN